MAVDLHNHIQLFLRGVDAHIGRDKKREFLMTPIVKISNLGHYKKFMETIIQRTFHCYTTHYQFHPCSSARAAALYVHSKYNFSNWMVKSLVSIRLTV